MEKFGSHMVIKICGHSITCQHIEKDMGLNAGTMITGQRSIQEVGEDAFARLLRVLSGEMTKNEAIGYYKSIDIQTHGFSPRRKARCGA